MLKSTYLPNEALQGENIPSHATWENIDFESIRISFTPPLKPKEVFNSETARIEKDYVETTGVEWDGYMGLLFESSKTESMETTSFVTYAFSLSSGEVIEQTKEIHLFRPELEIQATPPNITIDPSSGSTDNEIRIRNVGRGTLILYVATDEGSSVALETPEEQREIAERVDSDFEYEMTILGNAYPQYRSLLDELVSWDDYRFAKVLGEKREEYRDFLERFANAITNNKEFMLEFAGAYVKVIVKNIEVLQLMKRFVRFYESLVSKNILLVNPFDEVDLTETGQMIELRLLQTDRILNEYSDVILPKIELVGKTPGRIAVYNLFGCEY